MIIEFVCNLFFGICHLVISVFPKLPDFSGLNVSLQPFFKVIKTLTSFVDFRVVGSCLLLVLIVFNLKFIWSIFMWLVRKIPGVS